MIQNNVSLKPYNTFGIDVKATAFSSFDSVETLANLLKENNNRLPLMILGGGSNVLFTRDIDALVLRNEIKGIHTVNESETHVELEVGSGEEWHSFVRYTVEHGWGGIENMSLIPGSVGASPMQNIGAYGVEIKDCFVSLKAYHIESGALHTFTNEACRFGYRESVFKRELKGQYVIVSVTYQLTKSPTFNTAYGAIQSEISSMGIETLSVDAISQAVMNIRRSKLPDPKVLGNAGSFFKNPVVSEIIGKRLLEQFPDAPVYPQSNGMVKLAAGWLIEKAGLKGYRIGNCGVHEKQALVLVNHGGATGDEILALSQYVLDIVESRFGVLLEREVNII